MNEDRRTHRRGRVPVGLDTGVPVRHLSAADGSPGLETGLVQTPNWWPFAYTTPDNLKRLKRQRAIIKVKQWVRWPEAPF